jgi:hypothetical protein
MSDVKITVGGAIEDDAARRFVDAWHRAERGESFRERRPSQINGIQNHMVSAPSK